jgi:heavy metal sensor kinase
VTLLPRSIAGRLLLWQITGVTTILLALGLFFYGELKQIVVSSVDSTLHAKAQIFTGLLHEEHGIVELELSDIIAGEYVIPRSGHYYRVMKSDRLLAASPSLVDENFTFVPTCDFTNARNSEEKFITAIGPTGEPVRVLQYHYPAFGSTFDIILAESLAGGLGMIDTFRRFLLITLPLGILVLSISSWWIIRTGLKPLARFSATIETITHKNLNEQLDTDRTVRELSRLSSSFNAMLSRLNLVFESQKRLVADASHELKTPLAVINTQCDVTLQRERSPEEYVEAIRSIRMETHGITRLVNDLLSLARLDAGLVATSGFAPVRLCDLAAHALRLTTPLADELKIRVTVAINDTMEVSGVQSALEEALLNLVENSIRYNRAGGEVHISATHSENSDIAIAVRDTGSGISNADMERIFERFYRAAAFRSSDGSGLGLSIVKAIVEGHGGRITAESEPGKGSCFTLFLTAVEKV